jgi:hypothetical protein
MRDDDNVIDFQRPEDKEINQVPEDIIDILEILLEKAKNGTLESLIVCGDFANEDDDGEFLDNLTKMWNLTDNSREVIGTLEYLKVITINNAFSELEE